MKLYWWTYYTARSICWIIWFLISGARIPAHWKRLIESRREYIVHLWDIGQAGPSMRLIGKAIDEAWEVARSTPPRKDERLGAI